MRQETSLQVDKVDNHTRALSRAQARKEAKEKFIAFLREDPNVSFACEHIDMSREAVYKWREADPKFAKQWDESLERTKDIARSSIYRRGVIGWLEPMVSQGQIVYEEEPATDDNGDQKYDKRGKPLMRKTNPVMVRKYSDTLAIAYAKANLSEYQSPETEINTNIQLVNSTTLTIDTRSLAPAQLAEMKSFALRLKEGNAHA